MRFYGRHDGRRGGYSMLPLQKLKVLDVTQVMAGPYCCQLLADMGAEVIKVEPPGSGDTTRHSMGFEMKGDDTAGFLALNRNKKSITLNLKTDAARAVFHRLAREADVLVENYRPGVTKKLGIDYETLKEINPRLIYASISGFGQTGPYARRAGYDLIAQGMAGVMSVTGEPGGPPAKCGIPVGDLSAGLFCAVGILTAYVARQETGLGQYIDTSLFEGALALSVWESTEYWTTGRIPQPMGSAHRLNAPYQALRTRDGYINVGANNTKLWHQFCTAIERDDLVQDERFATNAGRMQHRAELIRELERTLETRDTQEWVEIFLEVGLPAGPINNYEQVFSDPHTLARNMVVEMEHPVEGKIPGLGIPVKLSDTPGKIRHAAPLLGEHTEEILEGLGFSGDEITDLRKQGAI